MWWLVIIEILIALAGTLGAGRYYLHMLQLESYQEDGYLRYLGKNFMRIALGWTTVLGVGELIAGIVLPMILTLIVGDRSGALTPAHIIMWLMYALISAVYVRRDYYSAQKKKMVYTQRMKRLIGGYAGVTVVLEVLLLLITGTSTNRGLRYIGATPLLLTALAPFITLLAGFVMQPVERKINRGYFIAAQKKLASRPELLKIGITGSYGKTSTKHALDTILSVKYDVFKSPASINTPMGLSSLINNKLPDRCDVFIAEMGARKTHDIKELVELIHPEIGLITSIGPQHLETFGTIDKVANTKYDLVRGLPKDGMAFFASDNGWVDRMYNKTTCKKWLTGYRTEGRELNENCDLWADNLEYGANGLSFTLNTKAGESVECECRLLGVNNVSNIVLCAAVALAKGLTLDEVVKGISLLEPVEHRLQVIPGGAMHVIDDAFNSNPSGAKEAVNVLASFPGKRIIVTPGFVEMGEDEDKFNYELGTQIAEKLDCAILVGPKHTSPIRKAMLEAGFDKDMIITVRDLDEATKKLAQVGAPGDSVLFENDLPDNYNE